MMKRLNEMKIGETCIIKSIKAAANICRRFRDIGLIENTLVECVGKSPSGDPTAFLIRGAVIAIRKDDCEEIFVIEG